MCRASCSLEIGEIEPIDGPFIPIPNQVGGDYITEADSMKETMIGIEMDRLVTLDM